MLILKICEVFSRIEQWKVYIKKGFTVVFSDLRQNVLFQGSKGLLAGSSTNIQSVVPVVMKIPWQKVEEKISQ